MSADKDRSPLNERFALESIIDGLACDLSELRQKKISVNDALARAALAKQIMNGVRLFVLARRSWEHDMSVPVQIGNDQNGGT